MSRRSKDCFNRATGQRRGFDSSCVEDSPQLNSTFKKVKAVADKAGIPMDEKEFHCRGEFKGLHKGRPNADDVAAAARFAAQYK